MPNFQAEPAPIIWSNPVAVQQPQNIPVQIILYHFPNTLTRLPDFHNSFSGALKKIAAQNKAETPIGPEKGLDSSALTDSFQRSFIAWWKRLSASWGHPCQLRFFYDWLLKSSHGPPSANGLAVSSLELDRKDSPSPLQEEKDQVAL